MKKIFFAPFCLLTCLSLTACSDNTTVTAADGFEVVEFPEGSVAYLNEGSQITYSQEFTNREVQQEGEVFYSVAKGESAFTVITDNGEISVLGTEFNLKATAEELELEVEEGLVKLKAGEASEKIGRGQKASFKTSEESITIGKADFQYKRWMNSLRRDFKKLGKEIGKGAREVEKESKKLGKKLNKKLKELQD